jgi:hypothetical protein
MIRSKSLKFGFNDLVQLALISSHNVTELSDGLPCGHLEFLDLNAVPTITRRSQLAVDPLLKLSHQLPSLFLNIFDLILHYDI